VTCGVIQAALREVWNLLVALRDFWLAGPTLVAVTSKLSGLASLVICGDIPDERRPEAFCAVMLEQPFGGGMVRGHSCLSLLPVVLQPRIGRSTGTFTPNCRCAPWSVHDHPIGERATV
jgi:hypothetical protein